MSKPRKTEYGWQVQWSDENGRRCTATLDDKETAVLVLGQKRKEVALRKAGVLSVQDQALAAAGAKELADHLADWKQYLLDKGSSTDHVERYHRLAREVLVEGCKWNRLADLDALRAGSYLAKRHVAKSKRWRANSYNHAVRALRGFGRFLEMNDRVVKSPFRQLRQKRVDDDRAFIRGELNDGEFTAIVLAAQGGSASYGMSGQDRAMLYRVRMAVAFRAKGLRGLIPESFCLEGEHPCIIQPAKNDKDRRRRVKEIRPELAELLRPWIAGRPAGKPVFNMPWPCDVVRMWRKDLAVAKVPELNARGERRDFYALRHTSISRTRRAAGIKAAQEQAGHASPQMTVAVYDHLDDEDRAKMMAALPVVPGNCAALALHSAGKIGVNASSQVQITKGNGKAKTPGKPAGNAAFSGVSGMGRAGIEPATHGFSVIPATQPIVGSCSELGNCPNCGAALALQIVPDLQRIVNAWSRLSGQVRSAVLRLVRKATERSRCPAAAIGPPRTRGRRAAPAARRVLAACRGVGGGAAGPLRPGTPGGPGGLPATGGGGAVEREGGQTSKEIHHE